MTLSPTLTLPIDAQIPKILEALRAPNAQLIIEAEPGAGKTTRVPPALLHAEKNSGKILVSEPRRIAARLSALRVAEELNTRVGELVGYQVRFDDKTSHATRLIYQTEGIMLRQLAQADGLKGIGTVILDEVHEQTADLELLLALLKHHGKTVPFRLIAMSATLDLEALSKFMPQAQSIQCSGRSFDVSVEYLKDGDERPLEKKIRSAVRSRLGETGTQLVFLPGNFEIQRAKDALEEIPELSIDVLHGNLPLDEQKHIVSKGKSNSKLRIILSTNIAESSLTLPDVTTVIDSGLARIGRENELTGASELELVEISKARAEQRKGRAGRVMAGHCIRLFSESDYRRRPPQDKDELSRTSLSGPALFLLQHGYHPQSLSFLSPPDPTAWQLAFAELERLSLTNAQKELTELGLKGKRYPLSPRLMRIALSAENTELFGPVCLALALLSERDILSRTHQEPVASDSDLLDRMYLMADAYESGFKMHSCRRLGIDARSAQSVASLAIQLFKLGPGRANQAQIYTFDESQHKELTGHLLQGLFLNVAARRGQSDQLLLASGTSALLSKHSAVQKAPLLLALAGVKHGNQRHSLRIHLATVVDPNWLFEFRGEELTTEEYFQYRGDLDRVEQVESLKFLKLTLEEEKQLAAPSPGATRALLTAMSAKKMHSFDTDDRISSLRIRLQLLISHELILGSELPNALLESIDNREEFLLAAIAMAAPEAQSIAELQEADVATALRYLLSQSIQLTLAREVPTAWSLPQGLELKINYEEARPIWAQSRLQDFFSQSKTITLLGGKKKLTLHLLAPNRRAVQVTDDLEGFWVRHYPEIRRELMRRYPKHSWPENGANAEPPPPGKIRRR